jgi:uncharacterized membrane protein (Fun14 family)
LPVSKETKIKVLYDVLTLISLDINADLEDIDICKRIGVLIGFSEENVNRVIQLIVGNPVTKD